MLVVEGGKQQQLKNYCNREVSKMKITARAKFQEIFSGKAKTTGKEYTAVRVLGEDFEGYTFFLSPEKAQNLGLNRFREHDDVVITLAISYFNHRCYINLEDIRSIDELELEL